MLGICDAQPDQGTKIGQQCQCRTEQGPALAGEQVSERDVTERREAQEEGAVLLVGVVGGTHRVAAKHLPGVRNLSMPGRG